MNRFGWSRACVSAAVCVAMTMAAGVARAEDGGEDSLSLKIAKALRSDRLFVRAGGIYVKIKTKSGDTRDVTGPVIKTSDLKNFLYNETENNDELSAIVAANPSIKFDVNGNNSYDVLYESATRLNPGAVGSDQQYGSGALLDKQKGLPILWEYLDANGLDGIGTPAGITGVASPETGTAGISLGYYLTDDHTWAVETYVLAAPLSTSVSIRGMAPSLTSTGAVETNPDGSVKMRPISINGSKIITSKILPPSVLFGKYWGDKTARFRPYTGLMAMYTIFLDTKATAALNDYVGGSNPGDTTVSIKNAFGLGPVLGMKYQLNDSWHASLNIGHVKLKTVATLTTRNTFIQSGDAILSDLGEISGKIITGEGAYNANTCSFGITCALVQQNGGLTTLISKGVSNARGSDNLGTFVRKTDTEFTNTIFMFSVGRTF